MRTKHAVGDIAVRDLAISVHAAQGNDEDRTVHDNIVSAYADSYFVNYNRCIGTLRYNNGARYAWTDIPYDFLPVPHDVRRTLRIAGEMAGGIVLA